MRAHAVIALSCALALTALPRAYAQYEFDPSAAHEMDNPGPRVFGAVKDERGALVQGATIVLDSDRFSLVLVTDPMGRFQINVPLGTDPAKVTARCSKPGFKLVRVSKRPGPAGVKPVVQIDCLLRASTAK